VRIVAAVGHSNTGKTFLLTRLIREFKRRGLQTCALKHCPHGFSLDLEDKDTWEYSRAGADGVALVSPGEWAVLRKAPASGLRDLARAAFPEADVILVEGGKQEPGLKKIEVLSPNRPGIPLTPRSELLAVVSERPGAPEVGVPVFAPGQAADLCDFILSQEEESMAEIELEIDGRAVPLNAFVKEFIEKTVAGMVTALDGVAPEPGEIVLRIRRGRPAAGKA
jgi:molybdopterin-guanine dinucleotide biosynthesis protein B